MRWINLPPVWLAGFVFLVWIIARSSVSWVVEFPGQTLISVLLALVGFALMALAALELRRAHTTIIPHQIPTSLVTSGIFRRTRNPIYLGDALILGAVVVWTGSLAAAILVPIFILIINRLFIAGEEANLAQKFGRDFQKWSSRTRRWL